MSFHAELNGLFAAVFLLVTPLAADPIAAVQSNSLADEVPSEVLACEAQAITDVVLEHHVDPPTRQEMWLAGVKAMLAEAGITHRAGLSAQISQLTTPAQFAEFVKRLWSQEEVLKGEQSASALRQAFVNGVLAIVPGDSQLISAKELVLQEQFQANLYVGTGIAIGQDESNEYPQIVTVIPGGPMERAGGRRGDLIEKIDNRETKGMSVNQVVDLLRGDEGTKVDLVLRASAEKPRTLTVTQGHVILDTLAGLRKADDNIKWDYRIDADSPIRYVKIKQIGGSTVHELQQLERRFRHEGTQAVILDLRDSDGDNLHHVVLLADALLDGGLIGRVRMPRRVEVFRADRECLFRDLPVAVLVDSNTSGGAEWIAAAVQDNQAGIIVGEPTAGAWHVHFTIPLPALNSGLSMRTGIFERPRATAVLSSRDQNAPASRLPGSAKAPTGVTPDRRIPPRDRESLSGPFAVLPEPVPVPDGSGRDDPILNLAVKILKAKINVAPTTGD